MADEDGPRYSADEAIARDRFRVWGDLSDEDYLIAWSRRLVQILAVAEPQNEHEAELQSARRVAASTVAAVDAGEPWPDLDPADEQNFDALVQVSPDIETHVKMVSRAGTWEDYEALAHTAPPSLAARLEDGAGTLDDLTRGRVSGGLFLAVLTLPLGCAFVAGFLALITLLGGVLTLIGLRESQLAGQIALVAALAGAAALVVVVYRKLIPRVPWLRRLINR